MDLLPGPAEDAALARVRPLLDAHLGPSAWGDRLRTGEPVPPGALAELRAAASAAAGITDGAVVAVALGRWLAPLEVLAAMIAGGPAAFAVPRPAGGFVVLGPPDTAIVVMGGADGVGLAARALAPRPVDGIDPTTPTAHAALDGDQPLDDPAASRARLLVAAFLAGLASGATDLAVEYAKTREQFGRPIGANQALKHALADCATRSEAAWSTVCYGAAALAEARPDHRLWLAAAARTAIDAADANARSAIQVHGGRGYTLECPAHLFLTRARIATELLGGIAHIRRALLAHAPDG
jgi:hypothetical protein